MYCKVFACIFLRSFQRIGIIPSLNVWQTICVVCVSLGKVLITNLFAIGKFRFSTSSRMGFGILYLSNKIHIFHLCCLYSWHKLFKIFLNKLLNFFRVCSDVSFLYLILVCFAISLF